MPTAPVIWQRLRGSEGCVNDQTKSSIMNSTSFSISNNVTSYVCPLCPGKSNAEAQFSDRTVDKALVETSCQPEPHTYHLGCITQHFENPANRKCVICDQEPLPLYRVDGAKLVEDSPYCEPHALAACRRGDLESLELFLSEPPEMANSKFRSALTGKQVSLLSVAASRGDLACLKVLLGKGANDLDTALVNAADGGHVECLKLLIEKGANNLNTALKSAIGHVECVRLLFEAGADDLVGAQMMAIRKEDSGSLQLALKNESRSLDDLTIFCAAKGHAECFRVLIDHGARVGPSLLVAANFGHVDVARVILSNVEFTSDGIYLALWSAARAGKIDCMKFLLEKVPEINLLSLQASLDEARNGGHTECVECLEKTISSARGQSCAIL